MTLFLDVHIYQTKCFVSGLVQRRSASRRGFRGDCCQPTELHRLCRQTNDKMNTHISMLLAIRQHNSEAVP